MPVLQPINLNDGIELKSFKKDAKSATHNHIAIGHNKHVNNGNRLQPGEPYPFGISRTKFHRRGKRDKKRLLQIEVFNFLEKPRSAVSVLYHSVVFLLILASLTLSVLSTVKKFQKNPKVTDAVLFLEILLVLIFTIEYLLRIWSCASHGTYSGCWGKMKFMRKPYMVIDLIVIVATIAVIIFNKKADNLNISIFRFLRFLQVLRILRVDRQRGAFKMVSQVVYEHRQELLTCWYMSFIILITCSFLVYLAERTSTVGPEDGKMVNLADGLYWGIISLLTIGYGDISPQTWVAKLITCIFSLIGTAFFALPATICIPQSQAGFPLKYILMSPIYRACIPKKCEDVLKSIARPSGQGILGSGFALQVAEQQRQKHYNRRRIPAAVLIQICWRRYACFENYSATWIPHLTPIVKRKTSSRESTSKPPPQSPYTSGKRFSAFKRTLVRLQSRTSESETYIGSQTVPSIPPSPLPNYLKPQKRCKSEGNIGLAFFNETPNSSEDENQATIVSLPPGMGNSAGYPKLPTVNGDARKKREYLTNVEKAAVRFIREVKFQVALRKFKEARRPYDVKDVIEQYTAGQTEMFGYIKKLQSRLETALGFDDDSEDDDITCFKSDKPCSNDDNDREPIGNVNIYGRLTTLEHKVETLDRKLDLVLKLLKDERRSASMMSSARSASFSNTLAPERYSSPERKRGDVYDEKPPLPRSNTEKEHRKKSRFKVTIIDADRGSDSDPTIHI